MTIIALIVWLGLLSILCIGGIIHMMDQSRPGSVASRNPQATPDNDADLPFVVGASFSPRTADRKEHGMLTAENDPSRSVV